MNRPLIQLGRSNILYFAKIAFDVSQVIALRAAVVFVFCLLYFHVFHTEYELIV